MINLLQSRNSPAPWRAWFALIAALLLPAFGLRGGVVLTTLHSFAVLTNGSSPISPMVQGGDGYFYSTAYLGGAYGYGTVFRISTNGALTTLYSFTGAGDGAYPYTGLVKGSDGNFYGTTEQGGADSFGTVFKFTTNGTLTNLYSFTGGDDGAYPEARLAAVSGGNLYGTTLDGGVYGYGTAFLLGTNGILTTLHAFTGGDDGEYPSVGLTMGVNGLLYGSTGYGGANSNGLVFRMTTNGVLTPLHAFTGNADGGSPAAALTLGSDGNLYGTTQYGGVYGTANYGYGTVFKIGGTSGFLSTLHSFSSINDGLYPGAALVQGSDGNLYGTTSWGTNGFADQGTVFRISTTGVFTNLFTFEGYTNGDYPNGLAQGSDGILYGTAQDEADDANSIVFKLTTNGAYTVLYTFPTSTDGEVPFAGLTLGRDGNFYGATVTGGAYDYGAVFQITPDGMLTNLYSFGGVTNDNGEAADGGTPFATLVQAGDGLFYGTTTEGSTNGFGAVFQISATGALTNLYAFPAGTFAETQDALALGNDGYLYGALDPYPDDGTIFRISTNGAETDLYDFTGAADGEYPYAGLVRGNDGYFYGATSGGYGGGPDYGTIFQIDTNGALNTLYSFSGGDDGGNPACPLMQGSDGYFYGTTVFGGTNNCGTVYRISATEPLATLYSFTGGSDGARPLGGLIQGRDGYLYGTTLGGGLYYGTVFKMDTSGDLTTLYTFTGGDDGGFSYAGLVQGSNGSFYGTTAEGGAAGRGTVFQLAIVTAPPVFQSVIVTNGGRILVWSAEAGVTYQLQYKNQNNPDLKSHNWYNLGAPIIATGAACTFTDAAPANDTWRIYRVEVLQ